MKLRKALSLALTGALCVGLLAGCGGNPSTPSTSSTPSGSTPSGSGSGSTSSGGSVYYLNFKPEQDADWQALAKLYTQETGVEGEGPDRRLRPV